MTFSPTGAGQRTAALQIFSNDGDENPFLVTLAGQMATALETWRLTHFGSAENIGPGQESSDPDGDRVVNLLEFATLSHPLEFSTPAGQFVKIGSVLEFTYQRPTAAVAELTYSLEWSESLSGAWSPVAVTTTVLSDDGVRQQVKHSVPAGSGGKRFVRLRVTLR